MHRMKIFLKVEKKKCWYEISILDQKLVTFQKLTRQSVLIKTEKRKREVLLKYSLKDLIECKGWEISKNKENTFFLLGNNLQNKKNLVTLAHYDNILIVIIQMLSIDRKGVMISHGLLIFQLFQYDVLMHSSNRTLPKQ